MPALQELGSTIDILKKGGGAKASPPFFFRLSVANAF
jgi:hypothetical protein